MSGGLGNSRWAPATFTANPSSFAVNPPSTTAAPKVQKAEPVPFDLANEVKSQQAFQARLKELKEALKPDITGKGAGNAGKAADEAKGFGVLPQKAKETLSPVKFYVSETGAVSSHPAAGTDAGGRLATTSTLPKMEHVTASSSKSPIVVQPLAKQPEGTELLISKADMDSIVKLLGDARLSIKDGNDEAQDSVPHDAVMSCFEDFQIKCDAVLAAVLELQEGVGSAKATFSQMIDHQNEVMAASRASSEKLISRLDGVLDSVEKSLRKARIHVPAPVPVTNGVAQKHHVVNGEAKEDPSMAGIVKKEKLETPVQSPPPVTKVEVAVAPTQTNRSELNLDGKQAPPIACAKLTGPGQHLRRVILVNLPAELELKEIFSIIWGGRVESLRYTPGESTCTVLFLTADACKSYCRAAAAGVPWPKDHTRLITIASVEERKPNEFESGLVETQVSRCIRVTKISQNVGLEVLKAVAMEKERVVERMVNGKYGSVSNSAMLLATRSNFHFSNLLSRSNSLASWMQSASSLSVQATQS
jgi:hypothetical protein